MAKREISSTLRNLKFMQRAAVREEPKEEASIPPQESFAASRPPDRRCVVTMEGNPHPGAARGRMSFQSFNPTIDKLNEEEAKGQQTQAAASPTHENRNDVNSHRMEVDDGADATASGEANVAKSKANSDPNLKRKKSDLGTEPPSSLQHPLRQAAAGGSGQGSSSREGKNGSNKLQKRNDRDWRVLMPPHRLAKAKCEELDLDAVGLP